MRILYLQVIFVIFSYSSLVSQNCYVRMGDMSGISISNSQLDQLEIAACDLIESLPDSIENSFKVFDIGFYFHNKSMAGGIDSIWQKSIQSAEIQSEYYILFGRDISNSSLIPEFRIDVKLPDIGCSNRGEYLENIILPLLNEASSFASFEQKEIEAMEMFVTYNKCEICDNGIDDDGDGYVDCDDLDCKVEQILNFKNGEDAPNRSVDCEILSETQSNCLLQHKGYLDQIGIYDTETALIFCDELDDILNAPESEVPLIESEIEICNISVPSSQIQPGRLLAYTEYRFPHNPPQIIAPDLKYGTDGDNDIIRWYCRGFLTASNEDVEDKMVELLHFASNSQYQPVADKFMSRFKAGTGGFYEDTDISQLIKETNELKNKVRKFGENLEVKLIENGGDIDLVASHILTPDLRYVFSASKGYLFMGPTILINDISQVRYHIQSFNIDSLGNWQGVFYVEAIDHFGLDDNDPNNLFKGVVTYQWLHCGFAAWWVLQHKRNYIPFRTKLRFVVCLEGSINISP
jgi:hypothetical protein